MFGVFGLGCLLNVVWLDGGGEKPGVDGYGAGVPLVALEDDGLSYSVSFV